MGATSQYELRIEQDQPVAAGHNQEAPRSSLADMSSGEIDQISIKRELGCPVWQKL
jgi:hypothetical protein